MNLVGRHQKAKPKAFRALRASFPNHSGAVPDHRSQWYAIKEGSDMVNIHMIRI